MKTFLKKHIPYFLVCLISFLVGACFILALPYEPTYLEKESIAIKWMQQHQDKWRYTLCNMPMD